MTLLTANDRPGAYPDSWYTAATPAPAPRPSLHGVRQADVCVIGAGFTGLSAALHLAQAGCAVRVLEAHRVGFGASGRNGGQLGTGQRVEQGDLERRLGSDTAQALWRLGEDAVALTNDLIAQHQIDCDRRDGIVTALARPGRLRAAQAAAAHMQRRYGYDRLEPLDAAGIARVTGASGFAGGVIDHGAAHLDPFQLVLGISRASEAAGVILHETSPVIAVTPGPQPTARTASGEVVADHLVLAANGYLGGLCPPVAARVMPINNFMVATEPLDCFPEILPTGLAAADDRFVISYWRRSRDNRLLFGGGESYGYRFPKDIRALVRRPLARIYPQLADAALPYAWGGTLAITRARLPHLTRPGPGLWSASGYSGHGIGLALLAGRLIAGAIDGTSTGFDTFARLPTPAFPGGRALRSPLLALAMGWFALRDRLGI